MEPYLLLLADELQTLRPTRSLLMTPLYIVYMVGNGKQCNARLG